METRGATTAQNAADLGVKIGSVVPDFTLTCVDGQQHKLSDFRGTKVMLVFHRFAYCPLCAYTISLLIGNFKKFAWASRLKVIMVFRTSLDYLKKGLTNGDAPIPRLSETDCYPFLALADEDGKVANAFQVEKKGLLGHGIDYGRDFQTLRRAHGGLCQMYSTTTVAEIFQFPSSPLFLPSELLIDEEGVLVDMLRAGKVLEIMPMERVTQFLLFGANIPSEKDVRNIKKDVREEEV